MVRTHVAVSISIISVFDSMYPIWLVDIIREIESWKLDWLIQEAFDDKGQ
jgi:hypothetical protein